MEPDQLDTARLLVSELVSNAVLHGEGKITLSAWLGADALHVEVRDQGGRFAHEDRPPDARVTGGWGLQLVSTESSRWGISNDSARVWFELDLNGARYGGAAAETNGRPSGEMNGRSSAI